MSRTGPVSEQKLQLNWMSLVSARMSGNPPVNGLRPSLKVFKFVNLFISLGIVPDK
jgi:hypothetical protein